MKKLLAGTLSALVVLLMPGPGAYAAVARAVEAPSAGAPVAPELPSLPSVPVLPSLPSSLSAPGVSVSVPSLGVDAPGPQAPAAAAVLPAELSTGLQAPAALWKTPVRPAEPAPAGSVLPEAGRHGALTRAAKALAPRLKTMTRGSSSSEAAAGSGEQVTLILQGGRPMDEDGAAVPLDGTLSASSARAPPAAALRLSAPAAASGRTLREPVSARSKLARWLPAAGTAAGTAAAFGAAGGVGHLAALAVIVPVILGSLILHEMGHAWAAYKLGDPTALLQGRMSFKPRDLLTHIDPVMTIAVPLVSFLFFGFIAGGARPVPFYPERFKDPVRGAALVGMAGPAVNAALAGAGAIAYAGLGALGAAPWLLGAAATVVAVNVLLAVFNLIPAYPLDGHHVARWLLPRGLSARLDALYARGGFVAWLPAIVMYLTLLRTGVFSAVVGGIDGLLLPAVAAAGLLVSSVLPKAPTALNPDKPVPVEAAQGPASSELIVVFKKPAISSFEHLSLVDVSAADGVARYAQTQQNMLVQLSRAGLPEDELAKYNATPVATYDRINAATIRLDAARADELAAELRARGDLVFPNKKRKIVIPVPVDPQSDEPASRNPVTMDETLRLTGADAALDAARKRWGEPGAGGLKARLRRLLGDKPPQPKLAVIDSGADTTHPLLKNVATVNVTSGENKDDIGHGSWVTSMVLNYAKWSRNLTHYKTFVDGSASTDDILKALNAAANDGNLVISNSWGDDEGDPNGPDSLLVRKLAEEGRVLVFAAGNAGPGADTIGAPAIVTYKDPKTGAIRVLSVAAADRNKKIAYFSSRGPGSPTTKKLPDYPHRPDLTAVGYNVEGAWPGYLDYDRVDAKEGTVKAISGTSMSTPDVAGAISLLATLFNVTSVGPRLDAVVNAVMEALEKTGQSPDAQGQGFLNVGAAYAALEKALGPVAPVGLRRAFGRFADAAMIPRAAVAEYASLRKAENQDAEFLSLMRRVGISAKPFIAERAQETARRRARMQALEALFPGLRDRVKLRGKVAALFARLRRAA